MKIVVAGAGAIGGYIGARLAQAGADVVLFARGPHLQAMQARGLRVKSADGDFDVRPQVTGDLKSIGTADVVFLGVKAHGLTALAPALPPLFGHDTVVVSTQNGIPWWYFQSHGGEFEGWRLERIDPGGVIAAAIEPRRVIGSLAYFATDVVEPGVIRHNEGNRISFGEPDGSRSDRVRRIAEALIAAGFRCPVSTRFRHEIWVKLLGNISFNPVSALTRATLEEMVRQPDTARLIREVMTEAESVANRLGIEIPISIDQRMAGGEKAGAHKTSMLQDLEAGRPMEIESIAGATLELGERLGVPMPATRAVYACVKLLDAAAGEMNVLALADEIEAAFARRQPIAEPPSARAEGLTLDQAYAVEAELARRRHSAGHASAGRKVGFASKALWRVMGLSTVAWASMYDDTVHHAEANRASLSIGRMFSPKIEPEIMIKLKAPLGAGVAEPATALESVEWIALGFEVIDCPFADWTFQPVDFVAACGFHAALIVGTPIRVDTSGGMITSLTEALSRFTVRLLRNGELAEEGSGRNVLRSPALCLAELASAAASQPGATPLGAGEIISTGTLTTSRFIAPAETWTAEVDGLGLPPISVHVTP